MILCRRTEPDKQTMIKKRERERKKEPHGFMPSYRIQCVMAPEKLKTAFILI